MNIHSSSIVSDKANLIIKNLNSLKRPVSAVADNNEVRNAKIITIKTNSTCYIRIF